jgi:hypothetical protein
MTWVYAREENEYETYINLDKSYGLYPVEDSGIWYIDAYMVGDRVTRQARLNGSWTTLGDALDVVRRLTQGVDPETF